MRYLLLLLLCGCSYTHQFGQVGPHKLYKIQLGSLSGPSQTMIGMENTNTHEITFLSPMGGNGILSSVTVAGSIVAGSYFVGKGLEKSHGDSTTVNANSQAQATADAQSASQSAPVINVPDGPPAPAIGIGPPFGSKQGFPRNFSK